MNIQEALSTLRNYRERCAVGLVVMGESAESDEMCQTVGRCYPVIVEAYLAEHPADDAEPVTEVWLSATFGPHLPSSPRKRYSLHFAMVRGLCVSWCPPCGDLCPCVCIESLAVIESPTRGDVRRLCAALGVKLSEGTV